MHPLSSGRSTRIIDTSLYYPEAISTRSTKDRFSRRYKWIVVLVILLAFASGFVASRFWRPAVIQVEPKTQVADFRITLPEGDTTIVITDRETDAPELARLVVHRSGSSITGVPEEQRRVSPRGLLSSDDVAFFKRELDGVVLTSDSQFDKANKIRNWLSQQPHKVSLPGLATRVPREAYEKMKQGEPVLCGNLAEIYVALCEAAGLTARKVGLSVAVQNGLFGIDTHEGAEVWLEEFGGWVYEDPTFNCYWKIDGKPASALSLHEAVMTGKEMVFAPREPSVEQGLKNYYIDPRLYFRHVSYEYKAGGTVLYFADERVEPLSLTDKNWIHTSDRLDIERLDVSGNLVTERRAQISPGIFVQLLGGYLFVRDRRVGSQGIRVRSSSGIVEGCAYLHQRAEDLGLFSSTNLARNPSFRITNRSNQLADDWTVAGSVEAMTVSGGQAMSALPGGRLSQRIQVPNRGRYLLYARVSVSRGVVNWSLSDAGRGAMSKGSIEPERISEIVSDVVESKSGYLDVQFEVPFGGAFRVLDVIVAEAPRFTDSVRRPTSDARKHAASLR